jgi:hypothetical protein
MKDYQIERLNVLCNNENLTSQESKERTKLLKQWHNEQNEKEYQERKSHVLSEML